MSSDSDSDPDRRPRFRIRRHGSGSDSDDNGGPGGALAAGMLLGLMAAEQVRAIATGRPVRRRRQRRRRGRRRHESVDEISMSDIDSPPTTLQSMQESHAHYADSSFPKLHQPSGDRPTTPPPKREGHVRAGSFDSLNATRDEAAGRGRAEDGRLVDGAWGGAFSDALHECKVAQIASGVYGRVGADDGALLSHTPSPKRQRVVADRKQYLPVQHEPLVLTGTRHAASAAPRRKQPPPKPEWRPLARRSGGLADICRM